MQPPTSESQFFPALLQTNAEIITQAMIALPIAGVLGAVLALRPRRRGTPPRSVSVIQTQILLALVGALVMLIVGSSVARAFGTAGVAKLIRYRAAVEDPKDATVMLAALSIGLAAGVEMYGLAAFATVFILAVLWVVESLEPEYRKIFDLKVSGDDPAAVRRDVEAILRRSHVEYEFRSTAATELVYEARLPRSTRTDRVSDAIIRLRPEGETEVTWVEQTEKKKKKKKEQD